MDELYLRLNYVRNFCVSIFPCITKKYGETNFYPLFHSSLTANGHDPIICFLVGQRLQGNLLTELGLLPGLQSLVLPFNEITGSIPSTFASLRQLHNLELHGNKLTSTIPEEFYDPDSGHSITRFNVAFNRLTGTIPSKISLWENLKFFVVSQNNLSGTIPTEIGLVDLVHLQLNSNELSGTLPTELGLLTVASSLFLQENYFTGTIPSEIGGLSKLEELSMFGKNGETPERLVGTIPTQLYSLTNLRLFNLSWQQLTGTIPTIAGNMTSLIEFNLSRNKLEGTIPTELSNIKRLEVLHVHLNEMTGSMPTEVCDLSSLKLLQTDCNPEENPAIPCLCCTACCDRTKQDCWKVGVPPRPPSEKEAFSRYCRT